uniref:hypothetical protein n=1 Tax=Pararhizobium sp. IMCC3301 TaxID=3067904 RepID=UPI0027416E6E|nr:hypothetical protein [Pararhizobium sp. IMCC3301]
MQQSRAAIFAAVRRFTSLYAICALFETTARKTTQCEGYIPQQRQNVNARAPEIRRFATIHSSKYLLVTASDGYFSRLIQFDALELPAPGLITDRQTILARV